MRLQFYRIKKNPDMLCKVVNLTGSSEMPVQDINTAQLSTVGWYKQFQRLRSGCTNVTLIV